MKFKRIITFLAIITASFSFANAEIPMDDENVSKESLLLVADNDIVIGEDNAPITIIEYASMSCGHCAHFHNNTYPDLKEKYIDKGLVRFVFRDFPLDEPALRGAMMARCSGDEGFEKFTKVMFSTQSNWAPKKNYLEILSNIGKLGGMTGEEFEKCIADQDLEHRIMKDKFYASKYLEVRSTPTLFINGTMFKGARDIESLSEILDNLLPEQN